MNNNIELNHLKYFYYTVLEGGVSQAAERLCVQQPVVSKMLKTLEENLEQSLFWKNGRSKSLTDYGQLVFRHCQSIFNELDKIKQISSDPHNVHGLLSVGGAEPIVNFLYENVFSKIMTTFPNLNFNVYTTTQSQLIDHISKGKIELGCLFYAPKLPDDLEVAQKVPYRFHLVVKKGLEKDSGTLESFIGSREIDDTSTHSFPTLALLRKKQPKAKITFSSNSLSLHKQLALKGKGVSVIPEFMIKKELSKGQLIDLFPKKKLSWDLMIVKKKSTYLSTGAQAFTSYWSKPASL